MKSPLSLKRNFSWNLIGNIVYGGYQWLIIALLAKGSGASTVGEYSLALAIVTPLQMFFNLQLRAIQASDAKRQFSFAHYLQIRLGTTALVLMILTVAVFFWPVGQTAQVTLIGVGLVKAVESIADVIYGAFQQAERMDLSGQARILESVVAALAFVAARAFSDDLTIALLTMAVALLSVLVLNTFPRLNSLGWRIDRDVLGKVDRDAHRRLILMGLPLGIAMGLIHLNAALPRFALGYFQTEFEVGIYAGFYQLVVAGTIVVAAMGQAITPILARSFVEGDHTAFYAVLNRLIWFALSMGVFAALLAFFAGDLIIGRIYSPEYAEYDISLAVLAGAAGITFASSFQGYAMTSARILTSQTWMIGMVIVVTTALLLALVPSYGVTGASLSVFGGAVTQATVGGWLLRQNFPGRDSE